MKNTKRIFVFMLIALFVLPFTVKAQVQTRYEKSSQQQFSSEELAQILAPIALYPDALLSQVLIAASYPYEVVEADRWLARNPYLNEEQLDEALQAKDWDVSVLSLCYYPKVINMMAENLNWTAKLGDAFVYQQQDVMDTIQDLRARASTEGNLATTNEQRVIVEERIIRIEPAYYNYLYVPVYDPFVVYGPWWYPAFMPFRIFYPDVVVAGPRIVFSPRIFLGFGVIGWSHFDWYSHHVVIRDIDRTKRFNRNYKVYHSPQRRVYWTPNKQKRVVHERRRQEYPRYRHTEQPSHSVPSRGSSVVVPPRTKSGQPSSPRLKPQTQPVKPQSKPTIKTQPQYTRPQSQPTVKPQAQPTRTQQQPDVKPRTQPTRPQPTIKPQSQTVQPQQHPRVVDRNRPTIENRGPAGTITPSPKAPTAGNTRTTGTVRSTGRDNPNDQLNSPVGERGGNGRGGGRDFRR